MAGDSTFCQACDGAGTREKVVGAGRVVRAMCWRCKGTGKFVKWEDITWPTR